MTRRGGSREEPLTAGGPHLMTLADLTAAHRPESWGGTRGETWPGHGRWLWAHHPGYMAWLAWHMIRLDRWFYKPVIVDDGVVQDGHHRIVVALALGWGDREIPVTAAGT